tara:strand:- start:21 stop:560 length:540 start_codon:yes stop_codon:yes gene_type:complete
MKITRRKLREMIVQELYSNKSTDYVGDETIRTDFKSSKFDEDTKRVTAFLDNMENIIRNDTTVSQEELNYCKNVHLTTLFNKINEIEDEMTGSNCQPAVSTPSLPGPDGQSKLGESMRMIVTLLDKMRNKKGNRGKGEQFRKQDIEYLKNNHIVRLRDKISFIEGAIEARLDGRIHESE